MVTTELGSTAARALRLTVLALGALAFSGTRVLAASGDADERQMGAQLFKELKGEREIVASSPLYDTLRPIAAAITRAVQPKYPYPIHFYIVHEAQPNAFAAPGGNVYVVDSLLYFVKNTEELAGTICHETSHLLHHDSAKKMKEDSDIRKRAVAGAVILHNVGGAIAIAAIARLHSLHYSRSIEESADITGSDTCAAAGYNPWGLVWLFRDFSKASLAAPPEILSDHPNDAHRVTALEQHFASEPGTFGRYHDDEANATALRVPAHELENFLR